jgi:hypothetical protein
MKFGDKMNNTITLTQEQIEALNRGEVITIQPEFKYPMYFKSNLNGMVVKFTKLNAGTIVVGNEFWPVGPYHTDFKPHTCTNTWTYLPNYKEKWYPKETIDPDDVELQKYLNLRKYVAEFDKGWVADWNDNKQPKCVVYFDHYNNKFDCIGRCVVEYIGAVYMSEQCAIELCRKLNSGRVVL